MGLFMLGIFKPGIHDEGKTVEVRKKMGIFGVSRSSGSDLRPGGLRVVPFWAAISDELLLILQPGFAYITAYTLGFAIPFFIMAFFLGRTRWILKYSNA